MSRTSELEFGLIALRMDLVAPARLLECVGSWLNALDVEALTGQPARALADLLVEAGALRPEGRETAEAAIEAGGGPPGVDPEVRGALLDFRPPAEVRAWLLGLPDRPAGGAAFRSLPRDARYEFRGEIARGGLGRVVDGVDRHLGREVAMKLVLDGMPLEVQERFVREARITASLDHPNVLPVYDFDELPGPEGDRRLVLCMKRIRGRDLGSLLAAIARGEGGEAARWSRARLLRVFQDICLGVAFAHSRGVLHRDLKPSNVMIGDFGETLIVDWGLAREIGAAEPRPAGTRAGAADAPPELTLEGDVLGTPLYMSPEQAAGRLSEMDARSDVYSLGGILYTLLTGRTPFEGKTRDQVLQSVLTGRFTAPSRAVEELRAAPEGASPDPVPPDLETICVKALAHRREDRYASALALHDDIQLFLEGVKEREREHRLAEEAVERAREAVARRKRLGEEAWAASLDARKVEIGTQAWAADKSALWRAQDAARELEREEVEAFAEADAALTVALSHERGHAEARRLKAELFWGRYLEAEARGDARETLLNRRVVEQFNDGGFDALLKGDGTLTVRTRAYPCACLREGRFVEPGELARLKYHPFSGRALDGHKGAEGLAELEPRGPVLLKVHGADCRAEAVAGADVWLWKYEELGRRLVPVTPDLRGAQVALSEGTAGARVEGTNASPYSPQGPGRYLGKTPIQDLPLPMGSYLLVVQRDGFEPIRCPVCIPRCGPWVQDLTLWRAEETPAGFVPVPAGPFGYQGDPENAYAEAASTRTLPDFFLARHPVTCGEYCEFLNDLARTDPKQAARRVPREAQESGFYWPGPPWAVPTAAWLASASPDHRARAVRLSNAAADWEEDWPVFGVSWEDALVFCAWRRAHGGALFVLPHELEWEKAARGVDRRYFPWGVHANDAWANTNRSHPGGARPVAVDAFPDDESPYGVRGLGGNSRDLLLNDPGAEYPGWRFSRGGSWSQATLQTRATVSAGYAPAWVSWYCGFRLAAAPTFSS